MLARVAAKSCRTNSWVPESTRLTSVQAGGWEGDPAPAVFQAEFLEFSGRVSRIFRQFSRLAGTIPLLERALVRPGS